jgi:predicted hydrocarbon binding protein
MGFEEAIKKTMKSGKVRKTMPDKVDIRLPRIIIQSLQWISVGYSSALYFAGKKLGKEIIAENIKGEDVKGILAGIGDFFKEYGIGTLTVKGVQEDKITVELQDCSTCYHMESIGKPICFFESGIICGILEEKLKKKVIVKETLCGGLGDEVDEFSIRLS